MKKFGSVYQALLIIHPLVFLLICLNGFICICCYYYIPVSGEILIAIGAYSFVKYTSESLFYFIVLQFFVFCGHLSYSSLFFPVSDLFSLPTNGHFQKIVGLSFRRCHLIIFLSIIDLIPFLCTRPYHCILFACRFTFCTPRLFSGSTIILNCFQC